jgi:hypothetical protein
VRGGSDGHRRGVRDEDTGEIRSTHKVPAVYLEMFIQIQHEYSSLPDPLKLKLSQIRTYYEFISPGIKKQNTDAANARAKSK